MSGIWITKNIRIHFSWHEFCKSVFGMVGSTHSHQPIRNHDQWKAFFNTWNLTWILFLIQGLWTRYIFDPCLYIADGDKLNQSRDCHSKVYVSEYNACHIYHSPVVCDVFRRAVKSKQLKCGDSHPVYNAYADVWGCVRQIIWVPTPFNLWDFVIQLALGENNVLLIRLPVGIIIFCCHLLIVII